MLLLSSMITSISIPHRKRLDEIKRSLDVLGCREGNFTRVELLFYEALTISRSYGEDISQNALLFSLKCLRQEQYQKTRELTKKPVQRELQIQKFIVQLKRVLSGNA